MTDAKEFVELYSATKLQFRDTVLLLQKKRVYLAFGPDAKIVSTSLGIEVSRATRGIPPSVSIGCQRIKKVAGKLLAEGHKVAVGRKSKKADPTMAPLGFVNVELELFGLEISDT